MLLFKSVTKNLISWHAGVPICGGSAAVQEYTKESVAWSSFVHAEEHAESEAEPGAGRGWLENEDSEDDFYNFLRHGHHDGAR